MKNISQFAIVVALCAISMSNIALAGPLNYSVDTGLSSLQVAIYIGGSPADGGSLLTAPQSPGSDTTSLGGILVADASGGNINFPGGSNITFANQPLDQEPDIGGGPSPGTPGPPAPAQYGLNVVLIDSGPVALRNAIADLTSPGGPIPVTLGAFDAGQLTLGTTAGEADYNLTGLFATNGSSSLAGEAGPNDTGAATVTTVGALTTITIPISVDVPISVSGLNLDAIFTGQIVATVTSVPEPSSLALAGLCFLALVPILWHRRRIRG